MTSNSIAGGLQDIYNELLAGNRISIHIPSVAEAHCFRIKLHNFKKQQELDLLAAITDEQAPMLSFRWDAATLRATISFRDRPDVRQYSFEILPPAGSSGAGSIAEDEVSDA